MTNEITTASKQDIAAQATALIQSQIGIEDMVFPCVNRTGQPGSAAVQTGQAPAGSMFLATDADDPEPVIVYKPGQKGGVRVHLLTVEKILCSPTMRATTGWSAPMRCCAVK